MDIQDAYKPEKAESMDEKFDRIMQRLEKMMPTSKPESEPELYVSVDEDSREPEITDSDWFSVELQKLKQFMRETKSQSSVFNSKPDVVVVVVISTPESDESATVEVTKEFDDAVSDMTIENSIESSIDIVAELGDEDFGLDVLLHLDPKISAVIDFTLQEVTFNHLSSKFSLAFVWNKFEVVEEMDGYKLVVPACVPSRSCNFCSQGVCEKVQEISLLHFEMFGELNEGYDILHGAEELLVIWQQKPPPLPPENVLKNEGYDQESSNWENTIVDILRVLSIHMSAHVDLITKGLIIEMISYSNQRMKKMFTDQSLITGVSFTPFDEQDGGGELLHCVSVCKTVPIEIQGHLFVIDFYVIVLQGVEIVVGMQWFEQLGDVVTNYQSLTVQFSWEGLPISLIGKDVKCPDSFSVQQFCKPQPAEVIVSMFQLMISGGNQCASQDIIPSWILQVLDSFEAGFDNDIVGDKKMLTGGATARGVTKSGVLVFFEAILEGLFWWLLKASAEIIWKGTFGTYNFVLEAEITMKRLPTLPAFIKEMICITESCEDGSGSLGDQSKPTHVSKMSLNRLKDLVMLAFKSAFIASEFNLDELVPLMCFISKIFLFSCQDHRRWMTLRTRSILRGWECYAMEY